MRTIFLFLIITFLSGKFYLFPQDTTLNQSSGSECLIIDSIFVVGNDVTEDEIILRELTFSIGDTLTKKDLLYNQDRIFSLGIFTKVELIPSAVENSHTKLIIYVEESWYLYPLPVAELRDRDWKKFSYGLDLVLQNFRGRNEIIRARSVFGYDPAYLISYYNPYLIWKDNIFFRIDLQYQNATNRSSIAKYLHGGDFSQKFVSSFCTIGKRFALYHRVYTGLGFNYTETPFYLPGISVSGDRTDRFFSLLLGYSYDSRDLAQFPKNGIYGSASIQFKGFGAHGINYQILNLDFREYRPITGDLGAKWRFSSRHAFGGQVPFNDFSFLGYGERIRGHFYQESEGNDYYIGSLEFFYPVIKDINISFDFIPIVPKELLSYRVALYSELFGDTGATKLKGKRLSLNNFNSGFGTGLTFLILPYNILRIELAFDEKFKSEWIIDLGAS
ncbi:MAG TPA: BamA/TamA family outer membrane protein, partial [Ignavibacteriaceae bacterium]|nr:BamA/TamA family outer membrane protein [Ignavibacteriaceae bacterium]